MSKLTKLLAGLVLAVGLIAAAPGSALARGHGFHHGWHGGHHGGYHGGWHGGWRGGWGLGWGPGWGFPYYYYPPSYYAPETCGWVRVRVWRHHRWHWRRVWRCWY